MEERMRFVAHIFGRVQGVGFRYFAVDEARQRGVQGWARNLPDGTVEVVAEGPQLALEELLALLRLGPRSAEVTHMDVEWASARGDATGFDIHR